MYCLFLSAVLFYEPNLFKKVSLSTSSAWNPQNPRKNCIVLAVLWSTLSLPVNLYENIYRRLIKSSTVLCTLLEAVVSFEHLLSGQKCRIIKCQMQELAHIRSQWKILLVLVISNLFWLAAIIALCVLVTQTKQITTFFGAIKGKYLLFQLHFSLMVDSFMNYVTSYSLGIWETYIPQRNCGMWLTVIC